MEIWQVLSEEATFKLNIGGTFVIYLDKSWGRTIVSRRNSMWKG